jgi:hypothetical protein
VQIRIILFCTTLRDRDMRRVVDMQREKRRRRCSVEVLNGIARAGLQWNGEEDRASRRRDNEDL